MMAITETTKIQTAKAVITTIQALHEKAKQTAKHYLRLEKELLELIIQIDKKKAFYRFGYSSLFTYVTESLNLSPDRWGFLRS